MPEGISGYANMEDVVDSPLRKDAAEGDLTFMLIMCAQQGVDTFFYLAGFLLSLLTLKELASRGGKMVHPIVAFALRYLRLTPSLAFGMLVYYKILVFFGNGPFAPQYQESINQRCDSSWWTELTYTMNFIPFDSNKVCMGWTWYLGNDMIFFVICIMLLPVYHRSRVVGWLALGMLLVTSCVVTSMLIIHYKLSVYTFGDDYLRYSYYAYSKPYTRIGAYLVGVVAAWILLLVEESGVTRESMRSNTGKARMLRGMTVASFLIIAFLIYIPSTDFGSHKQSWGTLENVLFLVFGRIVWACCWAVITFACYFGVVPWTDAFLSHRYWLPFTRLTYGAYLCHPMVIKLLAGREMAFYIFTYPDLFYRVCGNTLLTFSASAAVWFLIERPVMTLSSTLIKKPAKAQGPS
jgi:peptidoglycan/LPS O-acetylase OafA/YrhL